jgi:hypothetical protein
MRSVIRSNRQDRAPERRTKLGWRDTKAQGFSAELRAGPSTPHWLHFVKAWSEWRSYANARRVSRTLPNKECGVSSPGARGDVDPWAQDTRAIFHRYRIVSKTDLRQAAAAMENHRRKVAGLIEETSLQSAATNSGSRRSRSVLQASG